MFAFSLADYGLIALLGVAAIAVTIVGVERQRRGEDTFTLRRAGEAVGRPKAPGWLTDTLRLPCPMSSPTRAQLWLEMRCVGGQVLAVGVMTALVIPVLFSLWNAYGLGFGLLGPVISPVVPLLVGVVSMLGFRRRQGVAGMSVFEATRAQSTARLVGVKLLVTVVCVVGAWAVMATSFWVSLLALEPWDGRAGSVSRRSFTPCRAAALRQSCCWSWCSSPRWSPAPRLSSCVLYARRVIVTALGVGLYGLGLALAVAGGWAGSWVVTAHVWAATALIPASTLYVFRQALAERVLIPRHAGAVLLVWIPFAAVWLTLARETALVRAELSTALAVLMVSLSLVPLAAVALAPWSFGLLRHR